MTATTSIDTLVVGGGQAGIAMSEHLSALGIDHVVLEKNRVAEAWRTRRWDSLVANGPCWHDRFPNKAFDADPDAFVPHAAVADYLEAYARQIQAPLQTGVTVLSVQRNPHGAGFVAETTAGTYITQRVVAATGPFQKAVIPAIAPQNTELCQIHSDAYRHPQQLPQGAVLVIGGGSSGVQIADELNRAGRTVYLSVGKHERPPRRYRNRDNVWWLGVLGGWDLEKTDHSSLKGLAVSGAYGGVTIDFKELANQGITLLGMTRGFNAGQVIFADDLAANVHAGEADYIAILDAADAYIERNGLDLPPEPAARALLPDPECIQHPILSLDVAKAGITSVIWASGFALDFAWLQVGAFDANGHPAHKQGISTEAGVYFLGLPYLSGRGSSFIWGVWHDAKRIAEHIDIQRKYHAYHGTAKRLA